MEMEVSVLIDQNTNTDMSPKTKNNLYPDHRYSLYSILYDY